MSIFLPPILSIFKLALNPTVQKNIIWKKFCSVVSNSNKTILLCLRIICIIENISPPITGEGIAYLENKGTAFLTAFPSKRKMTASPID